MRENKYLSDKKGHLEEMEKQYIAFMKRFKKLDDGGVVFTHNKNSKFIIKGNKT